VEGREDEGGAERWNKWRLGSGYKRARTRVKSERKKRGPTKVAGRPAFLKKRAEVFGGGRLSHNKEKKTFCNDEPKLSSGN